MRIAIATCLALPEPDPDAALLAAALRTRGAEPVALGWDDPGSCDTSADLVVIRSTWNYYLRLDEFLAWVDGRAARGRLLNPADVIRANANKHYLADLTAAGVPTVPTRYVPRGARASLAAIVRERGWARGVVKPAVSAASFRTARFERDAAHEHQPLLEEILEASDAMVQPYLESVEGYGERSIVWIDGALTHAVRRTPRFGSTVQSAGAALEIAADERDLAQRVLAPWAERLLYARVDVVRDDDGRPMIMELELIEPSLFLAQSPIALERLADAMVRACDHRA